MDRISLLLFSSALLLGSCQGGTTNSPQTMVLQGATLFDGTGAAAVENSIIIIEGDRITCAGTSDECDPPADAEVINLSGKYITPGLIDAHVHFFQTGFFDSRPDALDLRDTYPFAEVTANQKKNPQRYYDAYLCSGITGVYDVGGFTWSIDFQESAEKNPAAPHVAASGPLITPSTLDLFNLPSDKTLVHLDSEETGVTTVQYISELGGTGVKLWQLLQDDPDYMSYINALADEAESRGNPLIAHATQLEQAKAAIEAGTELLVHSVSDTEVDEEFLSLASDNNVIYTPTLIVSSGYMLAYRAAAGIEPYEIYDPNHCVDPETRELLNNASQFSDHDRFSEGFLQRLQAFDAEEDRVSSTDLHNLQKVYEAGIPIAVGTDAGNPGTLHGISIYDEMEAMQQAGIATEDLIVMATRNGAKAMQRADDFGTLEAGKLANLIVLEDDPSADIANMRSLLYVMNRGNYEEVGDLGFR